MNMTRTDRRERKEKLLGILERMNQLNEIRIYKQFRDLSPMEQDSYKRKWDEYYEKCKPTTAAKRYKTMGEAWNGNDFETVQALADQAREQRASQEWEVQAPLGIDYQCFDNNDIFIKYRYIESELKRIESNGESNLREAFL